MRFEIVQDVFVGVHTAEAPTDEEWKLHCQNIERERHVVRGIIVFTCGGGPTSNQRQWLRNALHETPAPPTAILTASPAVRGIITALNWFAGGRLKAFEPADIDGALAHVGHDGPRLDHADIVRTLVSLARQLSIELPPSIAAGIRAAGVRRR